MFPSGSPCGELIQARDWTATPLGPIASWPAALRSTVTNMLHTKQPMLLFWGPELIQFYNDAFVPSFGQGKHPAAMGQPARECWAEVWPVVGAQLEAVVARGEPSWFADTLVPIIRNGRLEEVFWTYSYSPAFDDDGVISGVLVICTETTGRVLEARRLDTLSQLASSLASTASVPRAFEAALPIAVARGQDVPFLVILDERRRDTYSALDAKTTARVLEVASRAGMVALPAPVPVTVWPEPVTHAFVSRSELLGATFVFGLSPRLPPDDRYLGFLAQLAEQLVTSVRRIEDARARDAMLAERNNLLMQAPVATALMVGPDHVFQLANPLYCKMVGRDPTGKPYLVAFPELANTPLPAILARVYRDGTPFVTGEQRVALDYGHGVEDHYFRFNLEPVRDAAGNIYGMMAVASEITEQVRARQALEEVNRAKDDFLAMLGHELRNPLAPIVSAIDLMKRRDLAPSREIEALERQVGYVVRLVDDLLDVARITRGKIEIQRVATDVQAAVTAALEASAGAIEKRGHRLTVDVGDDLVVDGDPARLVQIVSNLVTNAVRYTPAGGAIDITARRDGDMVEIVVRDNGRGLAPELRERIFDLFVQGTQQADRAEGGLGIGLSVVKSLVALHGGTITADSAGVGRGSTFTLRMPASHAQVLASPPRAVAARGSKRVLVVDDNRDAAILLGELVEASGYNVTVVHDPQEALRILDVFEPDVAVLDIGLPGMNGYQLAAEIRSRRAACTLVALTGYGQPGDRARSAAAGFATHLTKPVSAGMLLDVLSLT